MGWLTVTDEQRASLAAFNAGSVRVNVVRGTQGGWLVCDDALAEAVPGGPPPKAAIAASVTFVVAVPAASLTGTTLVETAEPLVNSLIFLSAI